MVKQITLHTLLEKKRAGEKIVCLTCYDAADAELVAEAGVEVALVGDSVGNVRLGYENTLPVTLSEMLHHTRAAARGLQRAAARGAARPLLVVDLPYLSTELDPREAARSAGELMKAGAEAVKVEGGLEAAQAIKAILSAKVPVMGHLGLTPQSVNLLGGWRVQGRAPEQAEKMVTDAKVLEGCGVFAVVLEAIPVRLAEEITRKLSVPTIGIGAGVKCDGQILVLDDLLGRGAEPPPKFVRPYAPLRALALEALQKWGADVRAEKFPSSEQTYE